MQTEKIIFSKERRFGDKVNVTFKFFQENFKPLSKCLIYIAGPFVLLQAILLGLIQFNSFSVFSGAVDGVPSFGYQLPLFFLLMLCSVVVVALVVYEYINLYTDSSRESFEVSDVFQLVKRDFFRTILTGIGIYIITIIAFFLLVIPGIYVGITFSLIIIVQVKERLPFFQAVSRCFQLISGKWWSTFGLIFIMMMIQMMVMYAFSIPTTILSAVIGYNMMSADFLKYVMTIWSTIYTVLNMFLYALPITAICFQYFSLVEMKESKGLLERIDSLGTDAPVKNEETY